jgi:predicted RNA-binding protein with TRAM domain
VREGDVYDVTIEGIGEKGDGIAKIQGFVIVVPKTQQGQRVKVKVTAVRGKVSFGEVVGEATSEAPAGEETNPQESDEAEDAEDRE